MEDAAAQEHSAWENYVLYLSTSTHLCPETQIDSQRAMSSCGKRQLMVLLHLCQRVQKIFIYSDQ